MDENESPISETCPPGRNPRESAAKSGRGWGGARPGSGAPKGNLNALKHGRTSRRQAQLLESLLEVPEAREAFIALAKRARRRRKEAEEGAGVLMVLLLEKVAAMTLRQSPLSPGGGSDELGTGEGPGLPAGEAGVKAPDNHDQNNQEFLDFLNLATAQLRTLLEKQPRTRRTSIKPRATDG